MKQFQFIFIIFLISTPLSVSQTEAEELPFLVGERASYDVEFGRLKVGTVSAEIIELIEMNGRKVYHILTRSQSTRWVSRIYPVDNTIHTYIDAHTLLPIKIERFIEEGLTKTHIIIHIDQGKKRALLYQDGKENKIIYTKYVVYDTLAAMYKLRQTPIRPNKNLFMYLIGSSRVGRLTVRMDPQRSEEVKYLGRKKILDVYPIKQIGGWEVEVLLSADRSRIPVKVVAFNISLLKVGILSLTGWLKEYDEGNGKLDYSSMR